MTTCPICIENITLFIGLIVGFFNGLYYPKGWYAEYKQEKESMEKKKHERI